MKQITSRVEEDLFREIEQIANELDRSITYTIALLLQMGVKEKTRNRNGKKVHVPNNATNTRKSNAGG